jgi:hypothetical protein
VEGVEAIGGITGAAALSSWVPVGTSGGTGSPALGAGAGWTPGGVVGRPDSAVG